MSRELDAEVARALGWTDIHDNAYTPAGQVMCGTPPEGTTPTWSSGRGVVPHFSTDIAAAYAMEQAIIERGWHQARYYVELVKVITDDRPHDNIGGFDLVHASADQRCRAFVAAFLKAKERSA